MVLEKAEEPKIKLPTSAGSSKKQESFRKTSISALLTMQQLELDMEQHTGSKEEKEYVKSVYCHPA